MRVVIAGGGISGLIAAHTFIEAGHVPIIIDGGTLGGQWAKLRALKYLRYTPRPMGHPADLGAMLRSLGLQSSVIPVHGGAMLPVEGRKCPVVVPHPTCMRWPGLGEAFLEAHWAKTRGSGSPDTRAMNSGDGARDRADSSPDCRVEVEGGDFLEALILRVRNGAEIRERSPIVSVSRGAVSCLGCPTVTSQPYDALITTLPLWVFADLWDETERTGRQFGGGASCRSLLVQTFAAPGFQDQHGRLDYIYTPWSPLGLVHRLSRGADGEWSAEANLPPTSGRRAVSEDVTADARMLLGDDSRLLSETTTVGHLLPLPSGPPEYPERVYPLGRFAQWEARATVDTVLERAVEISEALG